VAQVMSYSGNEVGEGFIPSRGGAFEQH